MEHSIHVHENGDRSEVFNDENGKCLKTIRDYADGRHEVIVDGKVVSE